MRNGSTKIVFEKEVISQILKAFRSETFFSHLKQHKCVQQGCFFFHYSLANLMTNGVKMFTCLLFNAYVGIYQVRILFFDNNQVSSAFNPFLTIGNFSQVHKFPPPYHWRLKLTNLTQTNPLSPFLTSCCLAHVKLS